MPDVLASSRGVPRDPEDRRMHWGALRARLEPLLERSTSIWCTSTRPFVAHYAGVGFARRNRIPVIATYHTFFEEYLHHYVPLLPRSIGRALARRFTRSQCSAARCHRGARPSRCARCCASTA